MSLKLQVREVRHHLRNRISFDTTKPAKGGQKDWDTILHNRIAMYFKIYSSILNY